MEMSGSDSEEENSEKADEEGGEKKKRRKRMGHGIVFQDQERLKTLLVFLLIVVGANGKLFGSGRFRITESCKTDTMCYTALRKPDRNTTLVAIGKDTEGEAKGVLENVGLWEAMNWTTLYHFVDKTYVKTALNSTDKENLDKEIDLSGYWGSEAEVKNATSCFCDALAETLMNTREPREEPNFMVFLFFADYNCEKETTTNGHYCTRELPDPPPTSTRIMLLIKGLVNANPLERNETSQESILRNHLAHHGSLLGEETIRVISYFPTIPEFGDLTLWEYVRISRGKVNIHFEPGPLVIEKPQCAAKSPNSSNCENGKTCEDFHDPWAFPGIITWGIAKNKTVCSGDPFCVDCQSETTTSKPTTTTHVPTTTTHPSTTTTHLTTTTTPSPETSALDTAGSKSTTENPTEITTGKNTTVAESRNHSVATGEGTTENPEKVIGMAESTEDNKNRTTTAPGGNEEASSNIIKASEENAIEVSPLSFSFWVIVAIALGAVVGSTIIVVSCCCFCKKVIWARPTRAKVPIQLEENPLIVESPVEPSDKTQEDNSVKSMTHSDEDTGQRGSCDRKQMTPDDEEGSETASQLSHNEPQSQSLETMSSRSTPIISLFSRDTFKDF